jgi:DNA-binding NarL/FixJ family response regulator
VIIPTTFDLDEYVYEALRAGASGFLLKDTPTDDLLADIRIVAAGEELPIARPAH